MASQRSGFSSLLAPGFKHIFSQGMDFKQYPEEYAKATRTIDEMLAWTKKWDGYRLEMSKVFEWLMTEEFSSLRYRRAAHQEQVL